MKGYRERAASKVIKQWGVSQDVAALHALATHPFVGGDPRPDNGEFTKAVTKASWHYVKHSTRGADHETIDHQARTTVRVFLELAQQTGESHYERVFAEALGGRVSHQQVTQ